LAQAVIPIVSATTTNPILRISKNPPIR